MEVFAKLAGPPWLKSRAEIEALDPWWVRNVLFYPRDDAGNLIPLNNPEAGTISAKESFFLRWWKQGFPDWAIKEFWEETRN